VPPQVPSNFACPTEYQVGMFRANPGSGVTLVGNKAIEQSSLPNIRVKDFRQGLETFSSWASKEPVSLRRFPKDTAIADTGSVWLVAKHQLVPKEGGWVVACGQNVTLGPELLIFRATTIQSVNAANAAE